MRYDSPFDAHPGHIEFPDEFTGRVYRLWAEANKDQDDDAPDGMRRSEANWRAVLAIGRVELEDLPDGLAFDDMPYQVVLWAVEMLAEYIYPFVIQMPWQSQSGATAAKQKAR
jgi:hypothetical protein